LHLVALASQLLAEVFEHAARLPDTRFFGLAAGELSQAGTIRRQRAGALQFVMVDRDPRRVCNCSQGINRTRRLKGILHRQEFLQ
jgi:hypothetical protein